MIKVGVFGALGKMGTAACRTIQAASGFELVAGIEVDDDRAPLEVADVAVDFTHPGAVMDNIAWCVEHGVDVVAGTSGFTEERLTAVSDLVRDRPDVGVIVVPNFSIGAVLMMRFAAEAARFFESAEVIELHHPTKLDAPSGTSRHTAELIAQARRQSGLGSVPDATSDLVDGARGATLDGIAVHSVRLRGLVAHQEVLFGSVGETLTIRHDMYDREAAMPGMLVAIDYVVDHPGLTVGLDPALP